MICTFCRSFVVKCRSFFFVLSSNKTYLTFVSKWSPVTACHLLF